jgi:hypothetical protein
MYSSYKVPCESMYELRVCECERERERENGSYIALKYSFLFNIKMIIMVF